MNGTLASFLDAKPPTSNWRIQHAVSSNVCNQWTCKKDRVKIAKGELRVGIETDWEDDGREEWRWYHWGCTSIGLIEGLIANFKGEPRDVPGYLQLSPESKEQVELAFEQGQVPDKSFKGARPDLVRWHGEEITDTVGWGYGVQVSRSSRAGCQNPDCKRNGIKILQGELRLRFDLDFKGHLTQKYKHWRCISEYDLASIIKLFKRKPSTPFNLFIDYLPKQYCDTVLESLRTNVLVVPLMIEPPSVEKKPRAARKKKVDADADNVSVEDDVPKEQVKKPKAPRKKKADADADKTSVDDHVAQEQSKKPKAPRKKKVDEEVGQVPGRDDDTQDPSEDVKAKPKSRKKRIAEDVESAGGDDPSVAAPKKRRVSSRKKAEAEEKNGQEEQQRVVTRNESAKAIDFGATTSERPRRSFVKEARVQIMKRYQSV